jgi:hypothetical protein
MKTKVASVAIALASIVVISATNFSFAQSLPNFGAYAPGYGDSYGKPVSGTYPPVGYGGYAYTYRPYWHHTRRHHRYWRPRYW